MMIIADSQDKSKVNDEVFSDLNLLTKSLNDLDDRGLILSLAAFAEDSLGSLLKAFMLPSETTLNLLEGFNAPLGNFSARIKASYSIGLITKDQFQDLERLRKIRNEFAHTWKRIDMSIPKIAALIDGLSYSRLDNHFPDSLSEKVRSSISCILIELRSAANQITIKGTQAKLIGAHLMPGFSGDFDEQLKNARKDLENILSNIEDSNGKKREFYVFLLKTFVGRLTVLSRPETSEQKNDELQLLEDYVNALSQSKT